jgi:hypothetical protein
MASLVILKDPSRTGLSSTIGENKKDKNERTPKGVAKGSKEHGK